MVRAVGVAQPVTRQVLQRVCRLCPDPQALEGSVTSAFPEASVFRFVSLLCIVIITQLFLVSMVFTFLFLNDSYRFLFD